MSGGLYKEFKRFKKVGNGKANIMKAGDALFKALLGSDEPRAWHI